jgi:allantoinase
MTLSPDYLRYPRRGRGLDHDWFDARSLFDRPPVRWPEGRRVALWVTVHVEFFPLDMAIRPVAPVGAMQRSYPDYPTFTNRDYGNRIGIYRIMRVLDRLGIRATAAMNSDVARRYPRLLEEVVRRDWEVMASGVNMGSLHHGELAREAEQALVAEAVTTLRDASGQPVLGWHSPAYSESMNTLELVAGQGIRYVADWINDDMPFPMRTPAGPLHAMPLTYECADTTLLVQREQAIEDYEAQLLAAFRCLGEEATVHGGRILSIAVHPWVIGQPHRIRAFERALTEILASGSVWPATGSEILQAFRTQEPA